MYDVETDNQIDYEIKTLDQERIDVGKEGHDHYMIKEIFEQKHVVRDAVGYSEEEFNDLVVAVKNANNVFTIGAGGAFYAADQVAYLLREIADVRAMGLRAYEMDSYEGFMGEGDLIIAISQSGETADTLEGLELAKSKGLKIASAVNMLGSTITRMSDYPFFSRSGPEICVLSTKSGMAEVAFGYLLAKSIKGEHKDAVENVYELADYLDTYLSSELSEKIKTVAEKINDKGKEHMFLLGKGRNNLVAQIGALNVKEASYIHAEGFTAGELKHGVIALIDQDTPVVCFIDDDKDKAYMISSTAEVKARGAYIIGVATEYNELFDEFIELPSSSGLESAIVANIIPGQLLAYHIALLKGFNPDKPRNLAKSVTVK